MKDRNLKMSVTSDRPIIVFLDLEFTCWPDSIKNYWEDPARPPEILEIGAVGAHLDEIEVISTFSMVVRPKNNPVLSDYCTALTGIEQSEVDIAGELPQISGELTEWLRSLHGSVQSSCTWGEDSFDRGFLRNDCERHSVPDPFEGIPNIDLQAVAGRALEDEVGISPRREDLWKVFNFKPLEGRHRALSDAEDVLRIYERLKSQ
jgi:inhibitor of KinA sporulation pathway (predicted exonuclease)